MDTSTINTLITALCAALPVTIQLLIGHGKEKKAKTEIQLLKEQIRKLTEESASFTLSPSGCYVDRAGILYCGAGCRDPVTTNRIPLKPESGKWLYKCPKCRAIYRLYDPPESQLKPWDPLA